jgi:hypothetical protein
MRIASDGGWAAAIGTVLLAVAACTSLDVSSTEPAQPVDGKLSTKPGKVLTISVGQLLAATNGVTPVAFGKPAHGGADRPTGVHWRDTGGGHDKIEGVISRDGGNTLMIANDSDFGLAGLASATPPFKLKPKMLPNGTQDSGEILTVDMTKLPAKTESVTVPITVG